MTGKGYSLLGANLAKVLVGAVLNSLVSIDGFDSKADQNAIKSGYNYPGVIWKK